MTVDIAVLVGVAVAVDVGVLVAVAVLVCLFIASPVLACHSPCNLHTF